MNVVIVEDCELVSSQICRVLAQEERFHVLGVAAEETQALELIRSTQPDTVLLDLCLSPGSGIEVLRKLRQSGIGSRVFVLTNNTEDPIRRQCEALGISGFFDKSAAAQECFDRLHALLPPLAPNEVERLQALDETRLLDTPEQEAFDAITRLARDLTDTPMALVSLVDKDRQWFLSHQGLSVRQTSRSIAVCAHAIQGHELLEIQDLEQDTRFVDSPLVVGDPHLRFYAGVPLVVPSGHVLGTLCVLDTVARALSERQTQALKTLAQCVVAEMELRRKMSGLEHEVALRRAAEERVMALATRDILTQLPNRMAMHDRLDQHLRQSAREGSRFAFLFIDLDRFKLINDSLGHEVGDQALVEVAQRVTATLRQSDTVARLGGDEFAAILGNIRDGDDAVTLAQKINAALKLPATLHNTALHYDASIGVAIYPDHADNIRDLIRRADQAMYHAKRSGGGCSMVFTPDMEEDSGQLLALENELEQALRRDEIIAFYQPQLSQSGTEVSGMEALARWQHPRLGLVGPDAFIPFAESRNLIHHIGARMIHLALAQLAAWDAQGLSIPVVAVNLSACEIREGLVETVRTALTQHGLQPGRLEIEITESVLSPDSPGTVAVLKKLRRMGVRVSVDDFGSGYSSLGQLRKLPIDSLKIDRCFVTDILTNETDRVIINAVIRMSRTMGLRVVAEGVECAEQLALLRSMGCDAVQGFVHARPMAPEDFAQWMGGLAQHHRSPSSIPRIAVIEDVPDMARLIAHMLSESGYAVDVFGSGSAFLSSLDRNTYRYAVMDLGLPDIEFNELVHKAASHFQHTQLLLISGHAQSVLDAAAAHARSHGCSVVAALRKPFHAAQLHAALGMDTAVAGA